MIPDPCQLAFAAQLSVPGSELVDGLGKAGSVPEQPNLAPHQVTYRVLTEALDVDAGHVDRRRLGGGATMRGQLGRSTRSWPALRARQRQDPRARSCLQVDWRRGHPYTPLPRRRRAPPQWCARRDRSRRPPLCSERPARPGCGRGRDRDPTPDTSWRCAETVRGPKSGDSSLSDRYTCPPVPCTSRAIPRATRSRGARSPAGSIADMNGSSCSLTRIAPSPRSASDSRKRGRPSTSSAVG